MAGPGRSSLGSVTLCGLEELVLVVPGTVVGGLGEGPSVAVLPELAPLPPWWRTWSRWCGRPPLSPRRGPSWCRASSAWRPPARRPSAGLPWCLAARLALARRIHPSCPWLGQGRLLVARWIANPGPGLPPWSKSRLHWGVSRWWSRLQGAGQTGGSRGDSTRCW